MLLRRLYEVVALVGCVASGACSGAAVVEGIADSSIDRGVAVDIGSDVVVDAGMDAAIDAGSDVPIDASSDVPIDIAFHCATNADCAGNTNGPACDTATGQCIACVTTPDSCPATEHCDVGSMMCVPGCNADMGCNGSTADGGLSDAGAATMYCDTTVHACVQCMNDGECPAGMVCAGEVCVPGCNGSHTCAAGDSCCTGACVNEQSNLGNCGACGSVCVVPNALPACMNGQCAVGTCTPPYADCDHSAADGCEVDTLTDVANCGGCGHACLMPANAVESCTAGACAFTCNHGFADCDGDPTNGCETSIATSTANCGACGTACVLPNAVAACMAGTCSIASCAAGHGDCDGVASNGCEVDLTVTVDHCGTCSTVCAAGANAVAVCAAGACTSTCVTGYEHCDGIAADGCEVNIATDLANCGGCGAVCAPAHATGVCAMGTCSIGSCVAGYANCNGAVSDGCEISTTSDVNHCGACGTVCSVPGGTPACVGGVCAIGSCSAGLAHCTGGGTTCETNLLGDPNNCGACGNACASDVCTRGACVTFGGAYEVNDPTCTSCNAADALSGTCGCPAGFGTTTSLRTIDDCSGRGTQHGAVITVCGSASHGDWGGAYQIDDATACSDGCRAANPYTGGCSCPGGTSAVSFRTLADTACSSIIGSQIVFCLAAGGPRPTFGGAYQVDDAVPGGVGCRAANPYTGGCSCAAGTSPTPLRVEVDSSAGFIGSAIYVCGG